jgi:hypothetical protein
MTAQTGGIQAGLDQEQANNTLDVSNYNASMETLQAKQSLGNIAEGFSAGGVMLGGSPMAVLNQARQVAEAGIDQTLQQGGLQAQVENTKANADINATRAQLLGIANQYTSGLASADITQENADAQAVTTGITLGLGAVAAAIP